MSFTNCPLPQPDLIFVKHKEKEKQPSFNPFLKFVGCFPELKGDQGSTFHNVKKKILSHKGRIRTYKYVLNHPQPQVSNTQSSLSQIPESISQFNQMIEKDQGIQPSQVPIKSKFIESHRSPKRKLLPKDRKLSMSCQEPRKVFSKTEESKEEMDLPVDKHAVANILQSLETKRSAKKSIPKRRSKTRLRTSVTQVSSPIKASEQQLKKPLLKYDHEKLKIIKSESYVVVEYPSGQVVLSHRSSLPLEIASLTKIMTFYTVEKICQRLNLDISSEQVIVGAEDEDYSGTSAEVIEGDIFTVEQLLYGLMLPSGNDAAMCLAEWGGRRLTSSNVRKENILRFVGEMNKNSKALGLKRTRFQNPTGLPHWCGRSTAQDIATLINIYLGQSHLFCSVISSKEYICKISTESGRERRIRWENTNKLLRRQGFVGVKTGVTVTAGPCLASCYNLAGRTFIVVLLRANKLSRRFKETRRILYHCLRQLGVASDDEEWRKLQTLRKKKRIDSDNSEDEQQFVYTKSTAKEFKKRQEMLKDI